MTRFKFIVACAVTFALADTATATTASGGFVPGVNDNTADISASLDDDTSNMSTFAVNDAVLIAEASEEPIDVPEVIPPTITNINLHRGTTSANTEMELWSDQFNNAVTAGSTAFDAGDTEQYAYIAGFDSVTLVIDAAGATEFTINGTAYVSNDSLAQTVTFTAQGENVITVSASNADGTSAEYVITVNFLTLHSFVYGVYGPYMLTTKKDKWFVINDVPETGDEFTIEGNKTGSLYWRINLFYTIPCDEVVSDEAAEFYGEDGSDYCGSSGIFQAFNRTSVTNYNDGNAYYSGTQDGNSWESDWYNIANEGGMTFEGDAVARITNIFSKSGTLRGLYSYYLDGVNIANVYQHYVIEGGDINMDDPESYSTYIYMPGTVWEEQVVYDLDTTVQNPLKDTTIPESSE